jgi:hypothetical protein
VQQRFDPKTGELGSEFWLSVVDTRSRGVEVLREPSGGRNGVRGKEGDGGDWWLLKGARRGKMEGRGVRPGQCHVDEGKGGAFVCSEWRVARMVGATVTRQQRGRASSGGVGLCGRGPVGLTDGPRGLLNKSEFKSNDFKLNSTRSNLIQSKQDPP